jgi:hypothetical protein
VTSKERTADFTDFADGGDAAQGSGWRGKVARPGQHHPCRRALRLFLIRAIRVIRVIRGYIHPLGAATSRRHCPPRNPKLSGTRRPSPHPDPQSLRGRRRLVAVAPQRGRMTAQIESGAAWSRPVLRPSAWSASLRSLPRSLKAEVWRAEPRRRGPTRDRAKKGPRISRISRMGETPPRARDGGAKSLVRDSTIPAAVLSGSFLSVPSASSASSAAISTLSGPRRPVATAPLATQNFLGRDVPAPIPTLNHFGGGDVSSPWPHSAGE